MEAALAILYFLMEFVRLHAQKEPEKRMEFVYQLTVLMDLSKLMANAFLNAENTNIMTKFQEDVFVLINITWSMEDANLANKINSLAIEKEYVNLIVPTTAISIQQIKNVIACKVSTWLMVLVNNADMEPTIILPPNNA